MFNKYLKAKDDYVLASSKNEPFYKPRDVKSNE